MQKLYLLLIIICRSDEMLIATDQPDLTHTSISEARAMASKAVTGISADKFCSAALASGRYEIVEIC
jgi:hypothetical protein